MNAIRFIHMATNIISHVHIYNLLVSCLKKKLNSFLSQIESQDVGMYI